MLDEIRYKRAVKRVDIRDVLRHLELDFEEIGSELRFLCINPDHKESVASSTINWNSLSDKYTWFSCFGCDYSGTLPKLVSVVAGITIAEAKKFIMEFDSGKAPFKKKNQYHIEGKKRIIRRVKIKLPEGFRLIDLNVHNSYLRYLQSRGVIEADIIKYGWGLCPTGHYAKRVLLPVYMNGKLVSFFARHISTENKKRKHFNAWCAEVERVVFPYDEIDFNLKYIWVVESAFNLFKAKRLKLKNLICTFGNKLTEWKEELFRKFEEVRFIPDGDKGGREFVRKARRRLPEDIKVKSVHMYEGEDAGSISLRRLKFVLRTLHEVKRFSTSVQVDYSIKK